MVHGRQSWEQKETNMQRFKAGDTQLLVEQLLLKWVWMCPMHHGDGD
jgi:hypothetical protein